MTNQEILADPRFRRAILSGEYYRSVSVFLRLQHPDVKDFYHLPQEVIANAKKCVDDALFAYLATRKEMEEEFR